MTIEKLKIRLLALLWMVLGSSLVLLFIIFLNSQKKEVKVSKENRAVSISTPVKKKPPKKVKHKKVKKQRKVSKTVNNLAPPPSLFSSISGVEIPTPEFSLDSKILDQDSSQIVKNAKQDIVMTSDAVDELPVPLTRVAPEYPKSAKAKGITGFVEMSILIDENGNVVKAQILQSNPPKVFDKVALDTIKQWHFQPAKYKGKPVKVWVKQTFKFKLQ